MDLNQQSLADLLSKSYRSVTLALGDSSEQMLLPTRCQGWIVRDVLYHQLLDARRALRTYASPATSEPDVDDVTYWSEFSPGADQSDAATSRRVRARRGRHP